MLMRFAALGSGSKGNAWVVADAETCILIDCGFGPRECVRRLERLGLQTTDISAVFVTHEHSDHIGGVAACMQRFGWHAYMTAGTRSASRSLADLPVDSISCGRMVSVGALSVLPVTVPHDAREPVQFVISCADARLGILTDAGHISAHMVRHFSACDALVLECNHDTQLLRTGNYSLSLKQRISGGFGHLANDVAATLLRDGDMSRLQHLVAAHLSEENNAPELARAALASTLGCEANWIAVADQAQGLDWHTL